MIDNHANSGEITPFDFHGNNVRVLTDERDEPWFIAKDICDVLGIDTNHVREGLDDDEITNLRNTEVWNQPGRAPLIVSEAGFYKLVLRSRKPVAKEFQRWVTHDVLPSIRKHGGYLVGQERMTPEEMVAASMRYLESKIAEQHKQLEEQAPKVLFADTVSGAANSITVGVLAKILKQKGVPDMGQNRLFTKLRDDGFLCKQHGENWNMPTQYAMERGLFNVKERTVANPDGSVRVTRTTMVTGRGQIFFVNKYANQPVTAE